MAEQLKREINIQADTTDIVEQVLDMCPTECVVDRRRLCQRISTIVGRAEHWYKFGDPVEVILDRAAESATTVGDFCSGALPEKDGRTQCGHGLSEAAFNLNPKWMKSNGDV